MQFVWSKVSTRNWFDPSSENTGQWHYNGIKLQATIIKKLNKSIDRFNALVPRHSFSFWFRWSGKRCGHTPNNSHNFFFIPHRQSTCNTHTRNFNQVAARAPEGTELMKARVSSQCSWLWTSFPRSHFFVPYEYSNWKMSASAFNDFWYSSFVG